VGDDWPSDREGEPADWRRLYQGALKRAVVLLVLITGASMLAGWHWSLALLSHFVAWYALASLTIALICGLRRMPRWALAALVLFLIHVWQPLAMYVPVPVSEKEGTVPVKLLLANVLSSNQDHAALLELIAAEDPDVICVQEVSAHWAEALTVLESRYPTHHVVPRNDNFGIALYSRLATEPPVELFEEQFGVPALSVVAKSGQRRLHLLTLHTLPPLGADYTAVNNAQLRAAGAWVQSQKYPVVLLGDLNTTMYSPAFQSLKSTANLKDARRGFGPLGTWPNYVPMLRLPLDHGLVSESVSVRACRLGPDIGSDHLPLLVELAI